MISAPELYSITTASFVIPWLYLWVSGTLSTAKMIVLLFFFDLVLTIEAGINSNVLFIALLHVITIPVFFGLVYADLVEENRTKFSCFVCGKVIAESDAIHILRRSVSGRQKNVLVHAVCIDLQNKDRKGFSRRRFRYGIPR